MLPAAFKSRDNQYALVFFIISVFAFFLWGINYIPSNHLFLFSLASVFGIFMAFNVGGNDVANSFGTSVGAKTLTIKQALVIAAVFELSGAIFAGGEVTNTIKNGIINIPSDSGMTPMHFVMIMMSALFSAGTWLFIATKLGMPVSTTHSIVGGLVGAGMVMGFVSSGVDSSLSMIRWGKIIEIVSSWFISPLAGGIIAYIIFGYIKRKIISPSIDIQEKLKLIKNEKKAYKELYIKNLSQKSEKEQVKILKKMISSYDDDNDNNDFKKRLKIIKQKEMNLNSNSHLRQHIPLVAAVGAMVISASLLIKGFKHLHLSFNTIEIIWIIFVIGVAAYLISLAVVNFMKKDNPLKGINHIFGWFQIFTASSFAFSHGANDIANAIGPFAAILDVLKTSAINSDSPIPAEAMITFGVSLVVGLWFLGKEVITTVGSKLTEIKPTTGFSAELSSSFVILVATQMGLPISSTHVLIGAILGIGIYNKNANWALLKPIALAWIITVPVAMIGSGLCYVIISFILN